MLAVVTHYRCEHWLAQALTSLVTQTRPLDGIAVIDDASAEPPIDIVRRFPQVTLLAAERNVGPYRLVQAIVDRTCFDAYLLQDADDWSSDDRLAVLLAEAERTGAEMLGSTSLDVPSDGDGESTELQCFPTDVNAAYKTRPGDRFLRWGTSLVGRALVCRVGGLATGMRYCGDREFLSRAHYVAKVINVPHCCYYRRNRPGSLTSSADTGMGSPARAALRSQLYARAIENARAAAAGRPPDLTPFIVAEPITLRHLLGPPLGESGSI